jgi:glycosyltransferase involved in cell wall biosynthesis
VLEAQALGVPVLAMDADGVREGFPAGEPCSLVPLGDVPAFAKKLCELAAGEPATNPSTAIFLSKEQHACAYRELLGKILRQTA